MPHRVTSFPSQPALRPYFPDLRLAVLVEPITYVSVALPQGRLTIPPGTLTDGASIPYGWWWLTGHPSVFRYQRATLLHDYLYHHGIGTQKVADDLFLELLRMNGVGWFRRNLMWSALRSCGHFYWPEDKKS